VAGFARLSGGQFSMANIADSFVHLTNVAVQKKAADYDKSKGCKMLFSDLKALLLSRHGEAAVSKCLAAIDNLFLTSLLAVQPAMTNDKRCFEMYGYDVLLDETLKPWLIEVNASPSLTADTPSDYR
jgi:tubulin polyglutamylase TTLL9